MTGLNQWRQVALVAASLIPLLACQKADDQAVGGVEFDARPVDLRITEEPYYHQEKMNEKMQVLIPYLEEKTGLNIDYVPSINYAHSHYLLLTGEVDLLWSGSFGALKVLTDPKRASAHPIAVEKKSFINVLLANKRLVPGLQAQLTSDQPLSALKGQSMIFGADSSGSTFLTPILEMRRQGIDVSDVSQCKHESHHEHRAMILADTDEYSFAWVPGTTQDPLKFVPDAIESKLQVVWTSEPKRNYFVLASPYASESKPGSNTYKVQQALLALGQAEKDDLITSQKLGVSGFDPPSEKDCWLSQNNGQWSVCSELTELSAQLDSQLVCGSDHAH